MNERVNVDWKEVAHGYQILARTFEKSLDQTQWELTQQRKENERLTQAVKLAERINTSTEAERLHTAIRNTGLINDLLREIEAHEELAEAVQGLGIIYEELYENHYGVEPEARVSEDSPYIQVLQLLRGSSNHDIRTGSGESPATADCVGGNQRSLDRAA